MRRAFPEAEVFGYQSIQVGLSVDPGDRHVVAAAVAARADFLITRNIRHFPASELEPFGVTVLTPDKFLTGLLSLYPEALSSIVSTRAADLEDTVPETLEFLRKHVPEFVKVFEEHDLD